MGDLQTCPACGQEMSAEKPVLFEAKNEVHFRGASARMAPQELQLFAILAEAHPKPVTREKILAEMFWERNDDELPQPNILGVLIYKLRKALEKNGVPVKILARHGRGPTSGYALYF